MAHTHRQAAPLRPPLMPPPMPLPPARHDIFSAGPKKDLEAQLRASNEFKYLFEDRDKCGGGGVQAVVLWRWCFRAWGWGRRGWGGEAGMRGKHQLDKG